MGGDPDRLRLLDPASPAATRAIDRETWDRLKGERELPYDPFDTEERARARIELHDERAWRALNQAVGDLVMNRLVELGYLSPFHARIARERRALGGAYDQVRGQQVGPADDPLVRIEPDAIEASAIARGGWKGLGDVTVKGQGWGLVKFIWKHGEASAKPPGKQVTREDVLAFPTIIRTRQWSPDRDKRVWVVDRSDGERLIYVDRPVAGQAERRVIAIYVLDDPASKPVSPLLAAGPPEIPRTTVVGPSADTTAPPLRSAGADALPGDQPGRIPGSQSPEGPASLSLGSGGATFNPGHRWAAWDPSPGAPPRDLDAEARAELDEPEAEHLDPAAGTFPEAALYEAALEAGRVRPEDAKEVAAADAEARRLAGLDKAYEQAAICVLRENG